MAAPPRSNAFEPADAGVNARRAIVDGRVDNKFVDVPCRLQGIQLRFHLFRGTEQRRRFRRAMRVGLLPA